MFSAKTVLVRSVILAAVTASIAACGSGKSGDYPEVPPINTNSSANAISSAQQVSSEAIASSETAVSSDNAETSSSAAAESSSTGGFNQPSSVSSASSVAGDASSNAGDTSSSADAVSSEVSSSEASVTYPVDCDAVDIGLGKQLFAEETCVGCHGAVDESTGIAPGAIPAWGFNLNALVQFNEDETSLNAYIASSMMNSKDGCADGDTACLAKADHIATYLKSLTATPWCQTPPQSSSSDANSSEAASSNDASSEISSSSDAAESSSSDPIVTPSSSSVANSTSSVASSDAVISSSSAMVVSSSSVADSSSSMDTASSDQSSLASSSSEAVVYPVDCDAVDIDLGKQLFAEETCVGCHGAVDESTGIAPGAIPAWGFNLNALVQFNEDETSLNAYIAANMMNSKDGCADGDTACLAKADHIATYLKSLTATPWCQTPPQSSSSDANSSEAASSSEAPSDMSSSSDATESSSSDASSSDMAMSSSSVMMMSSSSAMSSSSEPTYPATVQYIYPAQGSHLGGQTSVPVSLKVIATEVGQTVTRVELNGTALVQNGDVWSTPAGSNLAVNADNNDQEFAVEVEVDGAQSLVGNALVLNNKGGDHATKAGGTRVFSVRGLGIDEDDEIIYFTNPFDAQVLKYNAVTGESDVIHQGSAFNQLSEALYWPLTVDSVMDTVYVAADEFSYSDVGNNKFDVHLVRVQDAAQSALVTEYDAQAAAVSTKGLIIDVNSVAATSGLPTGPLPTSYSLNVGGTTALLRWYLSGSVEGRAQPLNVVQGESAKLTDEYGLAALAAKPGFADGSILVAREYSETTYRGKPALVEVTSKDDGFGTITAEAALLTTLDNIVKPTALLYNREGTHVYIADADRIWLMDMSDYSKTLVTSSSNLSPGALGEGPQLGGKITTMALHPTMDYLYLAADNGGLMMVDLATGNRITIVK